MNAQRPRRIARHRLPLTITLDPAMLAFVEQCAEQRRFRSVDEFFDAALKVFRRHVEALNAYMELEEARGQSLDEVLGSTECEIVFTRQTT
jgi:hypothetical protein